MTPQKILLFGIDNHQSSSVLLKLLVPHFNVQVQLETKHNAGSSMVRLLQSLQQCPRKERPGLLFLFVSADQLTEARGLLESLQNFKTPVIVVTESGDCQEMFELMKDGAADFVIPPFTAANVLPRAWRLLEPSRTKTESRDAVQSLRRQRLIGKSPVFLSHVDNIPLIAECEANVLILGETGTGKELYARAIHYRGARAGKPFMPVNCGAIPSDLVENELFGHERGAFTHASTLQTGVIAEANGGTLFLDEIDCLPIMAQVKLLRFLQEKEYRPLGSATMRHANVRIIAASNLDLQKAVENGKVRQDLFYRLNVISLVLPPLRERIEDIPLLARHFLAKYSREFNREPIDFAGDALNLMMMYSWPGNVRELEHVIERAIVLCKGPTIKSSDLVISNWPSLIGKESLRQAKAKEIARFEKNYIQALLSACQGNITKAAEVAQKNRRAFWQLMQKHEISVGRFKSTIS